MAWLIIVLKQLHTMIEIKTHQSLLAWLDGMRLIPGQAIFVDGRI
jgi:hypothetical protein